jgi:hypothetical protein
LLVLLFLRMHHFHVVHFVSTHGCRCCVLVRVSVCLSVCAGKAAQGRTGQESRERPWREAQKKTGSASLATGKNTPKADPLAAGRPCLLACLLPPLGCSLRATPPAGACAFVCRPPFRLVAHSGLGRWTRTCLQRRSRAAWGRADNGGAFNWLPPLLLVVTTVGIRGFGEGHRKEE